MLAITAATTAVNPEAAPPPPPLMERTQAAWSVALSLIPLLYMFAVGCFLFVVPSHFLQLVLSCFDNNDDTNDNHAAYEFLLDSPTTTMGTTPLFLDVRMARLVGCVLLGQVLSCVSLVYPLLDATLRTPSSSSSSPRIAKAVLVVGDPKDAAILDKFRSSVASLSIMSLLLLVEGLVDDRTSSGDSDNTSNESNGSWTGYDDNNIMLLSSSSSSSSCGTLQSTVIIASGAVVLILSSASMMVSFWPPPPINIIYRDDDSSVDSSRSRSRSNNRIQQFIHNIDDTPLEDAQEPLLASFAEQQEPNNDDDDDVIETQPVESSTMTSQAAADEGTYANAPSLPNDQTINDTHDVAATATEEETFTSRICGTTRLLKLAAPEVFYLYVGCAVLLVRLPFSLSIPHFVSTTLGAVSRGDFASAREDILLLFILGTIDAAFDFWCVFLFGYANQRIARGVRIDTFSSILRQEVAFFDKTTSGELASRLNSDCGEMAGDLTWFFRFSIESVVRITGIVFYMLIRCPILGSCAITIIPVVALVNKLYGNWLNKNAREVQDALAAANQVAQETFSCIRTVIAFASEQQEYRKYKECIDHQFQLNVRQLYISGVYYMVISTFLINTVVQSTLLLIGTSLIQRGSLTGEVLLAFMLYQGQLQSETMNMFQSYTSLVKSSGAGDKVFSLLDRSPAAPGTGSTAVTTSEIEEDVPTQEISTPLLDDSSSSCSVEIKNVNFTYPCRQDNQVLKNFNLRIPQGKTVALVGASGCGKSTIVGLLQRFYDPSLGSILVDGEDLRGIDVKLHRRRIGVVTQNPVLFKGTIMSNIVYGCPSASLADAMEAARLANALAFVNSFPDGFDTDVGERGVQLSGGQMQRITIARAIIKKPALLLLDEATSALDAASEQAVQNALDKLLKSNSQMTTVVVAHRLRTVRNADMIAFVENGQVAEIGTHDELLKLPKGHYQRMIERAGNTGQLPDQ